MLATCNCLYINNLLHYKAYIYVHLEIFLASIQHNKSSTLTLLKVKIFEKKECTQFEIIKGKKKHPFLKCKEFSKVKTLTKKSTLEQKY